MRLPEIQAELRILAATYDIPRLGELADEMTRRKSGKKAPVISKPVTPIIRQRIIRIKKEHPKKTQFEIAAMVGVNQGRVSEVLRGKRK